MSKKINKVKVLALSVSLLLIAGLGIAGCGSNNENGSGGNNLSDTLYVNYNQEITNEMDYTRYMGGVATINFADALLEYTPQGKIVPALAQDWSVSKDGLTYTFYIRKGVNWVDNEGNDYAEIKAQDWVTGLKHTYDVEPDMYDPNTEVLKGVDAYVNGKDKDFNHVGIKAIDKYTLQYKLIKPVSYMQDIATTYYPINADFLKEKGDSYGAAKPDGILYCGPYIMISHDDKSSMEWDANPEYWDPNNVHIKKIKFIYSELSNAMDPYNNFVAGKLTTASLVPSDPGFSAIKDKYQKNIYATYPGDGYSIMMFNLHRGSYNATKKTSDSQKQDTSKAILNKNFRQAISYAFDRETFVGQTLTKEYAKDTLRNEYTPPSMVSIDGKKYSDFVQDDLKSMNSNMKSVNLNDANNSGFNASLAKSLFNKAKTQLGSGVSFPIHLDYITKGSNAVQVTNAKSFKQMIEQTLGSNNVVVDINMVSDDDYIKYIMQQRRGQDSDYDLGLMGLGFGVPDPLLFTGTFLDNAPFMYKEGLDLGIGRNDDSNVVKVTELDKFSKLWQDANKISQEKIDKRYKAAAKAEAKLLDICVAIPYRAGNTSVTLSKVVPFSAPFAIAGGKAGLDIYKYQKIQNDPVTKEAYDNAKKEVFKNYPNIQKENAQNLINKVKK